MIGNIDDETNFSHKLLLTNEQVAILSKVFANYLSTVVKFSKSQLSEMVQLGGCLGSFVWCITKNLTKINGKYNYVIISKCINLIALTAAASVADEGMYKQI